MKIVLFGAVASEDGENGLPGSLDGHRSSAVQDRPIIGNRALRLMHSLLGTHKHKLQKYVIDVFVDIGELMNGARSG